MRCWKGLASRYAVCEENKFRVVVYLIYLATRYTVGGENKFKMAVYRTNRMRFIENVSGVRIKSAPAKTNKVWRLIENIYWCFSTFRTKNIHIYLVCCCQRTIATIDISFQTSITSRARFIENISSVFPHLERRISTYIWSVAASAQLLRWDYAILVRALNRVSKRARQNCVRPP